MESFPRSDSTAEQEGVGYETGATVHLKPRRVRRFADTIS